MVSPKKTSVDISAKGQEGIEDMWLPNCISIFGDILLGVQQQIQQKMQLLSVVIGLGNACPSMFPPSVGWKDG